MHRGLPILTESIHSALLRGHYTLSPVVCCVYVVKLGGKIRGYIDCVSLFVFLLFLRRNLRIGRCGTAIRARNMVCGGFFTGGEPHSQIQRVKPHTFMIDRKPVHVFAALSRPAASRSPLSHLPLFDNAGRWVRALVSTAIFWQTHTQADYTKCQMKLKL